MSSKTFLNMKKISKHIKNKKVLRNFLFFSLQCTGMQKIDADQRPWGQINARPSGEVSPYQAIRRSQSMSDHQVRSEHVRYLGEVCLCHSRRSSLFMSDHHVRSDHGSRGQTITWGQTMAVEVRPSREVWPWQSRSDHHERSDHGSRGQTIRWGQSRSDHRSRLILVLPSDHQVMPYHASQSDHGCQG
jgi:hypothetical protein